MREDVRLVEVKCVDDVGVAQGLEKNQVVVIGPVRAGGDDGVLRGAFADRGGELGLDAVPAIAVATLRLIEDFEEDAVGIEIRVVGGQRAPEIDEALDGVIVAGKLLFEIIIRVDRQLHRQALIEDHLHRGVEVREIVGSDLIGLLGMEHGPWIHGQADVVEAHGANQRDVLGGNGGVKVFFGVAGWVGELREPIAQIDAVAQMGQTVLRDARIVRGGSLRPPRIGEGDPREQAKCNTEGKCGDSRAQRMHEDHRSSFANRSAYLMFAWAASTAHTRVCAGCKYSPHPSALLLLFWALFGGMFLGEDNWRAK